MKNILLLHDNARPHSSLRTREAIVKMGSTVLPHSAYSPDLASSDCHLFGRVKDTLRGRHFADNELVQSFRDVVRGRGREFYNTVIQRRTQSLQTCVEKDEDCGKNSLIIA
jgi:hypothetical protein